METKLSKKCNSEIYVLEDQINSLCPGSKLENSQKLHVNESQQKYAIVNFTTEYSGEFIFLLFFLFGNCPLIYEI